MVMVLQFKREQYHLGKFRYLLNSNNLTRVISFGKMNEGNIAVSSDESEPCFGMLIYSFFKRTEKDGNETKQLAGEFTIPSGIKGEIYYCGRKGSNFLNGVYYWTFEVENQKFIAYEVGFGRKGIYLCIWKDNKLFAIVSKDVHTKRFESNYTIYSEDDMPLEMVCICSLFWDLSRYYPTSSAEEFHTLNTWQKELKNKFDADFIKRISCK